MKVYFVTHPEVVIDPAVPVPDWGLSETGRARFDAFCDRSELAGVTAVHASAERKAVECAERLRDARGLDFRVEPRLGENDRSSTGFVPPPRFWEIVEAFFARPEKSVLGWERAIDAQARIRAGVDACLASGPSAGDICILSHGGVGGLLLCDLLGEPISRRRGQPIGGGGCFFVFDAETRSLLQGWQDIVPAAP